MMSITETTQTRTRTATDMTMRILMRHIAGTVSYTHLDIAIRAAITGHLVLSTLHTNDAAGTILRLVDMGVAPYMVAVSYTHLWRKYGYN